MGLVDGIKRMSFRQGGLLRTGGIILALVGIGYCGSSRCVGPETHLARYERSVGKNAGENVAVSEKALGISYNQWLEGQRQLGVNVENAAGYAPMVQVDPNSGAQVGIADISGVAEGGPPQFYGARRVNSELADKLGNHTVFGDNEEVVDQCAVAYSSIDGLVSNYPKTKWDLVKGYTWNSMLGGAKGTVGGMYETVKGWLGLSSAPSK